MIILVLYTAVVYGTSGLVVEYDVVPGQARALAQVVLGQVKQNDNKKVRATQSIIVLSHRGAQV
jgi:hypothetical protein